MKINSRFFCSFPIVYAGLVVFLLFGQLVCSAAKWKPAESPLYTRWTKDVSPENVLPEYPRPQMVRADWQNLNGLWDLEIMAEDDGSPESFSQKILVPFCVESALSGVRAPVTERDRVWYRRSFTVPAGWKGKRVLLHFGAVDWDATVLVNGKEVGRHKGGYDPFSFDITQHLVDTPEQTLVVSVWDPGNKGGQAVGKQSLLPGTPPGGIFYTRVSGIWQTPWLEAVPQTYIARLKMEPDIDTGTLNLKVIQEGASSKAVVKAEAFDGDTPVATAEGKAGQSLALKIPKPKLWSPDSPFLYDLRVTLTDPASGTTDEVKSYFGMRKISLGKDEKGITRLMLNNKFVFQLGPLDQGFWPDGLYTAPTEAAIVFDLEMTKKYGFNMIRKHVKVEPARWYYWCDKLGLLVWQDMPSGGHPTPELKKQYEVELKRMIDYLYNQPCVVMWVPFNEGWGQHDTERIVELIRKQDPTRLVNNASGWVDKKVGDVMDVHSYPGPYSPKPEPNRAAVLGEFGGLGLNAAGHTWDKAGWGYRLMQTQDELNDRYESLYKRLHELIQDPGLSAAVYTQTSDIEAENNGLMSYDREMMKINPERAALAHQGYFSPEFIGDVDIFIDTVSVAIDGGKTGTVVSYSLDGSQPTEESPVYVKPIELTKTATVTARSFWPNGKTSRAVGKTFTKVKPIAGSARRGKRAGLLVSYYGGIREGLPDFSRLTPEKSMFAKNVDLTFGKDTDGFGLLFEGCISVPATGVYTFYCTADDGAKVTVAGKEVVTTGQGSLGLAAGTHPVAIEYFQRDGDKNLRLEMKGPGIARAAIPVDMLSCNDKKGMRCLMPEADNLFRVFHDTEKVVLSCPYENAVIYYTLDGSVPTIESARYTGPIEITETTTVQALATLDGLDPSRIAAEEFRKEKPLTAIIVKGINPGVKYTWYTGKWESAKDVKTDKPMQSGTVKNLDITKGGKTEDYAIVFEGLLKIPETGQYRFTLEGDDGGAVMIDEKTVCAKEHFYDKPGTGDLLLEKGLHLFKLLYFQGYGGRDLKLTYTGPDGKRKRVTGEMLFYK